MIKKTCIAAGLVAAFGVQGVQAQDYQMEGGFTYIRTEVGNFNDDAIGLDFTYHFAPVRTAGRPLAEAAFLDRSSNVSLAYTTFDDTDLDIFDANAEFYFGDFYLAGGLSHFSNGGDSTDYSIAAGWLPVDGLLLTVSYTDFDETSTSAIGLGAKYVTLLGNGTALNLEGGVSMFDDDDDTMVYALAADYYFNPGLSVGLRFEDSDASGSDPTWGAGARYFFTPAFSGQVEYARNRDLDLDVWAVRLALRF